MFDHWLLICLHRMIPQRADWWPTAFDWPFLNFANEWQWGKTLHSTVTKNGGPIYRQHITQHFLSSPDSDLKWLILTQKIVNFRNVTTKSNKLNHISRKCHYRCILVKCHQQRMPNNDMSWWSCRNCCSICQIVRSITLMYVQLYELYFEIHINSIKKATVHQHTKRWLLDSQDYSTLLSNITSIMLFRKFNSESVV